MRLWELKKLLDRYSPTSILEFGSGGSTVLFSLYAKSAGAEFVSIEEDSDWRETVLLSAKKANLKSLHNFASQVLYCRRLEDLDSVANELVCHYELSQFHAQSWDLVYVDGPTNWSHRSHFEFYCADPDGTLPNADTALLSHRPSVVIIDGRRSTVRYLIRKGLFVGKRVSLSRKYLPLAWHEPLFRGPYHTIFESVSSCSENSD